MRVRQAQHHLRSYAAQEVRRFAMFTSSTTRPYTISALNLYKVRIMAAARMFAAAESLFPCIHHRLSRCSARDRR